MGYMTQTIIVVLHITKHLPFSCSYDVHAPDVSSHML